MTNVLDEMNQVVQFCQTYTITPQAIEVCSHLGTSIRVSPEDFTRLNPLDVTHTVFGGDNPWLLHAGHLEGFQIRAHDSVAPMLAAEILGQDIKVSAKTLNAPWDRFVSNVTATLEFAPNAHSGVQM